MADAKKRVGYWHNGTTGNAKSREALEKKGYRVIGQNLLYLETSAMRPFDVVVAEKGVDVKALQKAYGDTKVHTVDEALALEWKEEKKAPAAPFNPDAAPAPRRNPRRQG